MGDVTPIRPAESATIQIALLDPKWQGRVVTIDGLKIIALTIMHPQHGEIHSVIPRASAAALRDWLTLALAEQS